MFLLFAGSALQAQDYDDPALGRQPVVSHTQDFKPLGIRAGAFMLHPGVELAAEWTDNVFYDYVNEEDDTIYHIRPYVTALSTWSRHSLSVRLAADIGRYSDFGIRDYEDLFFTIDGRFDVVDRNNFIYRFDWMELHEDLNARNAEQGIEPTDYTLLGGALGYNHFFNRLSLGIRGDLRQLDFDDALREDGTFIDNEDRDRDETILALTAGYQFKTDKQAFVTAAWYGSDYDQPLDRNGYNRDSDGFSISGGINFTITGALTGNLGAGYYERDYDDPVLQDVDGWGLNAGLNWYPTELTSVRANVTTAIDDTTAANASGYLRTLYSLRVDHELLRNLQLTGLVSYTDFDYEVLDETIANARSDDEIWRAGIGFNWFLNRSVYLSASYDYQKMSTNVPFDGYEVNRVWLVLGLEK